MGRGGGGAVAVVAGTWALLTSGGVAQNRAGPPPAAPNREPAASAATATPRPVTLGELLSDPSLRADRKSALVSLYAQWGVNFEGSTNSLDCDPGRPEGLRCLFRAGTWAKLRRLDLPAIIELATPTWERRYATVVALDGQTATLDFGGRRYTFSLSEVDLYWDGSFVLLWKAPTLTSPSIPPGARSKDVAWVRQRLSELDGVPIGGKNQDVFDDGLRARVIAFQRSRSLVPDGIVGEETLIHLTTAPRDPGVPRLSRARP